MNRFELEIGKLENRDRKLSRGGFLSMLDVSGERASSRGVFPRLTVDQSCNNYARRWELSPGFCVILARQG